MKKKINISLAISSMFLMLTACGNKEQIPEPKPDVPPIVEPEKTTYSNLVNIYDAYDNIVTEKTAIADPACYRDSDGTYYLYCTETDLFRGDRGYGRDKGPILKSDNLIDWYYAGSVFRYGKDEPVWGASGANVWAPDICKIGDKYVFYYSLALWGNPNPGIGCASSDTPYGPWTQHGKIFDSNEIGVNNSIDPQVVIDDDGKIYMFWGSFMGIYGIELAADGLSVKNPATMKEDKFLVAGSADGNWHWGSFEGTYIIKRNNKWIYFGSRGTCCEGVESTYHVLTGISDTLTGEYLDNKGVSLKQDNAGTLCVTNDKSRVTGVGHNSVTTDDNGDYWLIYHGYDVKSPTNQRRLFIDKLLWDDQGFPYVENHRASIREEKDRPFINKNK